MKLIYIEVSQPEESTCEETDNQRRKTFRKISSSKKQRTRAIQNSQVRQKKKAKAVPKEFGCKPNSIVTKHQKVYGLVESCNGLNLPKETVRRL